MSFNNISPFGQPTQPTFGQPAQQQQQQQQQQAAHPFALANGSGNSPSGKITFGSRAATGQPDSSSNSFTQLSAGQSGISQQNGFGAFGGAGNPFGSTSFGSASVASGSQTAFGGSSNTSPASFSMSAGFGSTPGGFGASTSSTPVFGGAQQGSQGFGSFASSQPASQGFGAVGISSPQGFSSFGNSPPAAQGFGAFGKSSPSSGAAQQAAQGFGAFGNSSASTASADASAPAQSGPFARLGTTGAQPASQGPSTFGITNPFGQPASAAGFGSGSNPFAATASAKPAEFGRAAKRKQQEPQQSDQQQTGIGSLQRPSSPASMVPRQLSSQRQQGKAKPDAPQNAANDFADPAALAARSARFGGQSQQSAAVSRLNEAARKQAVGDSTQDSKQAEVQLASFSQAASATAAQPLGAQLDDGMDMMDEGQPSASVEGFCTGMCPDYQLRSRTQHANENSLEVIDPLRQGRGIDLLATKKFERNVNMSDNAALPNMFRTLPALKTTEKHLMDYLDSGDPRLGLGRVSMYLWDRQRSIRQDMAWQRMEGPEVMNMYEEHAMTAIYMDAEMSHHGDPGTADSTESYHPGLVIEQLNKTLISLTAMYEAALLQGQPAANAAEFNTYAFIMLLMGTRQKDGPTAFFQQHILPYSPSPYVALALRLHRLVANDINPWAFFKLVDKASYRLALWLQFLFPKMRFLYLTRSVSAAGPTETRPVSELAYAMWFDSEDDTLDFLSKAGLQAEQSPTGVWQIVLHRGLKLESQAAAFRQRSERVCRQQLPVKSQNISDQGTAAAAAVQALVGSSGTMLQARQAGMPQSGAGVIPRQRQSQVAQAAATSHTPKTHTSQAPASPPFTWAGAQTRSQASPTPDSPQPSLWGAFPDPSTPQPCSLGAEPASSPQPDQQAQQAWQEQQSQQQLQQQQAQQQQQQQLLQQQKAEAERVRLQQLQRKAQQQREAEQRAQAERLHQQEQQRQAQAQAQAKWQEQQAAEQRRQQEQQRQHQQQLQHHRQLQLQQQQQQQQALALKHSQEQERQRLKEQEHQMEGAATAFHRRHTQTQALQQWRQLTVERKAHYGQRAIMSKLSSSLVRSRPPSAAPSQAVWRETNNSAQQPLPGHLQSQQGTLQEALPLPSLVAPALAAANEEEPYLRWKAVIHYMQSSTAADRGPDFAAARWMRSQMAYQSRAGPPADASDSLLRVAFTSLLGNPVSQTKPLRGIFTSVCDASHLTASLANSQVGNEHLQTVMAGASVLVLLITRADKPSHTEASLMQMLAAAPSGLIMPLLILTTASDLHQGVHQWLNTLPGKLGALWQRIRATSLVCLAKPQANLKATKLKAAYSRTALRDGLKWSAAHAAAQLCVKALPLEQWLSQQLEQQLEPLRAAHHLLPQAWVSAFNQMLVRAWQQINEAAAAAVDRGGWPPPELAAIDATLPEGWWGPSSLSRVEGALSSLCLPAMSSSLGSAPQQAVPIYVQHYLGIKASGSSWQQTLAAAMHSRIRAIQQQSLPPVVMSAKADLPPLLPSAPSTLRLPSSARLEDPASSVALTSDWQESMPFANGHRQQGSSVPESMPLTSTSYAAAVRQDARHTHDRSDPLSTSYADVLKTTVQGVSKRKIPESEPALPASVKRHQNGFLQSLTTLQKQTQQLQQLIAQSRAKQPMP